MKDLHRRPFSLPRVRPARLLLVVGILHFFLLLFLGLTRHWSFLTSGFDLGIFDQALWGILHGTPFLMTGLGFDLPINQLGLHFNPILAVFAPFYAIYPSAEWLILIQALAISVAAWPIYVLGIKVLSSEHAAFLWALAYLLNPFVLNAAAWDFQPIALAAPIMALAVLAVEIKHSKLFLFSCFLLLLIREHFGVAVVGFGILWWLRRRTLTPAFLAITMGGVGFVLVVGVIMPALSPTEGHLMMSQDLGQLSRYGWLGTSLGEVMRSLIFHPIKVMAFVFLEMGGWFYLSLLLLPLGFSPLVGAEFLLPAAADLAANLLSSNPMPRSLFAYHSIALIPLLIVAGMHGARRLSQLERYSVVGLGRLVLILSLIMAYRFFPLPLPGAVNIWKPLEYRIWPEKSVTEIKVLLPAGVSVSAQANIAPHFTQRVSIRAFPSGLGEVDCAVLRLASPTARIEGDDPGAVGSLAHHLQMAPAAYLTSVRDLVASGEYGLKYRNPPWLVVCRGASMGDGERDLLFSELDDLARIWLVPPSP